MSRKKPEIAEKQLIEDKSKRINMKSKRKKTLLKKIIEFSQMFDMQIFMVMHDREMNKVIEYNSGSSVRKGLFTKEQALYVLDEAITKLKIHKYITDDEFVGKYTKK